MFAKLSALVSSGPVFPYTLGTQYATSWGNWSHYQGVAKEGEAKVSIFRLSALREDDTKLVAARNGVKRLRTLRHPNVLAFKDTLELDEKGEKVIYLVTEPVTPLAELLRLLDIVGPARDEYVAMGLYHIARAVSFLNNDCSLIHGHVCMNAVMVTEQLDWRLGGFDLLSEHVAPAVGTYPLASASWMVAPQYKAAELAKGDWAVVAQSPPWAIDAWGLGCLMQEAFSGQPFERTEALRNTGPIPKAVLQARTHHDYQRLLASAPTRRLNPAKLAESSVLKNKLVDTIAFLENLAVKDGVDKDVFFKKLPAALPNLPLPVVQRKLLPMLASALEFGGAPAVALAALLQVGRSLQPEAFAERVVPALSKLFASNDRAIRRSLLESIDSYGPGLSSAVVEASVYPQVAAGFADGNAYLRELTLKSMLVLAPKLSQQTLNQSLLKHLAKLQVDEEAPIRANTTILLGNLAAHLSDATCKRVLLNAFTRALKDSFPPARIAGLKARLLFPFWPAKAMLATAQKYSADEAATRILPAVAPLGVDAVQEVRSTALLALQSFTGLLMDNARTLDDVASTSGSASKDLAQNPTAGNWSVGLGGTNINLGWAMSSFGLNKAGASPGEPPHGAQPSPRGPAVSTAAATPPQPMASLAQAAPSSAAHATPPDTAAVDGWGNDDDLEGLEDDSAELEARQRLASLSTRPPAAARAQPGAGGGANGWREERWGDEPDSPGASSAASFGSALSSGSAAKPARGRASGGPRGGRRPARGAKAGGMRLGATKISKAEDGFEF